jgi:hypothetical protein
VDAREGLGAVRVVQVMVPDHADGRDREPGNEPEVVLVPLRRPRAGEVSELGEEQRRRIEPGDLGHELGEDAVRRRIRPGSRVAGDDEAERIAHRRALDPVGHHLVPSPGAVHLRRDATARTSP